MIILLNVLLLFSLFNLIQQQTIIIKKDKELKEMKEFYKLAIETKNETIERLYNKMYN